MKFHLLLPVTCFLLVIAGSPVEAADTSVQSPTEREKALELRLKEMEAQLEGANRTIADLQEQLEAAKDPGEETRVADSDAPDAAGGRTLTPDAQAVEANRVAAGIVVSNDGQGDEVSDTTGLRRTFTQSRNDKTPASITSLGPEDILLGGIDDVSRIGYLVPALQYGQTGHDVRLSMRGARTASVGPEATSAVAVYEDGIYQSTTTEGLNSYVDVERIDVLRGPQSTAFGQHAYAGAVSIVSNKPNFDGISGYAEAENGLPDKTRWRLALNLPVSETVAVRLAGVSETRAGLVDNAYIESDADDLNNRSVQSIRASALWQPSENFSLLYWSRYQDENGTGSAPWGYQQIGGYVDGELMPGNQFAAPGAIPDGGPWGVTRNMISSMGYENWINTFDMNWDVGFANLQWLSSYTSFHGKQAYDNDYTNLGSPTDSPFAGWKTSQTGWSTELRMTSQSSGALSWLAGLYFSDRSADWDWLEGVDGGFETPAWDVDGDYSSATNAAFGQLTYEFNDRFSLTGGLRYNKEKKTTRTDVKDSWDDVLWKAALEYNFSERSMTYFSASTGYRPGGMNTAGGVNPTYDSEKLTAYEIGLKTMLADGKVNMSLAGWYNDFKDFQSQSFLVLPYPGSPEATEYLGNGGSADAKGIEAEILWTPMPYWKIATQLNYTDAKFGNYEAANLEGLGNIPGHTEGDSLSFDGWHPALSPEWVFGLQTSYTFQLEEWGTFTPYLQTSWVSDYYANDINVAGVRQGSHSRTDMRFIWMAPQGNFQIQFYYLNAEDDSVLDWARVYNPAARPEITTLQGNWKKQSTYGIIFNYTF